MRYYIIYVSFPDKNIHDLLLLRAVIQLQASKHDGFHSELSKKGNEITALLAKAKSSTPANAALLAKITAAADQFDAVKKDSAKRQDQLKKCLGDAQVSELLFTCVIASMTAYVQV